MTENFCNQKRCLFQSWPIHSCQKRHQKIWWNSPLCEVVNICIKDDIATTLFHESWVPVGLCSIMFPHPIPHNLKHDGLEDFSMTLSFLPSWSRREGGGAQHHNYSPSPPKYDCKMFPKGSVQENVPKEFWPLFLSFTKLNCTFEAAEKGISVSYWYLLAELFELTKC